jgi:hypothetical protein
MNDYEELCKRTVPCRKYQFVIFRDNKVSTSIADRMLLVFSTFNLLRNILVASRPS